MGDYVSNDLLKEATTASQRAGRPTDELGHMNAFSWFTTVLSNACRRYIDADNRQNMLAQVWGAAAS